MLAKKTIYTAIAAITISCHALAAENLATIVKQVAPSVVNLTVEKNISAADAAKLHNRGINPSLIDPYVTGSGVIINSKHGVIVTNDHVVHDSKTIVVQLKDGSRHLGKLVGEAKQFDLAVLIIKADNLRQIEPSDSDTASVGNYVAAIGSPFGLEQSVTAGIISGLDRANPRIEKIQNFIQTDAPINPGNSGGALIDMHGRLVGINTALYAPLPANVGIGFAIPSNMVYNVAHQLIQYGNIKPGLLGVMAQNINPSLAHALKLSSNNPGVLVTKVLKQAPAGKAGLKIEDIIIKVDGRKVRNAEQLHNMMALTRPGTTIKIQYQRNGQLRSTKAVAASPASVMNIKIPMLNGVRLRDFSELESSNKLVHGVQIIDIDPTSVGALAGLIPGDVIISFNGKEISNIVELQKTLQQKVKHPLVKILRGPGTLFLVL